MAKSAWLLIAPCIILAFSFQTSAKLINGRVFTASRWSFLDRFAFLESGGRLSYDVEYPLTTCCPHLVFYYDDIWMNVYPQPDMSCTAKMAYAKESSGDNLIYKLHSSAGAYCTDVVDVANDTMRRCQGEIRFQTVRTRWWFISISQCDENLSDVMDVKYEITLTNGNSWEKHLSADETHLLETYATFLLVLSICAIVALVHAKSLWIEHLLHRPYEIFLISLAYELLGLLVGTVFYTEYVLYGEQKKSLQTCADLLHAVSEVIFVSLLLLLAKGYTVTRGRLSSSAQIKLAVFICIYSLTSAVLFFVQAYHFDPGIVRYLFDSPAGTGIVALRAVAWMWFCFCVICTVSRYPEKRAFYIWFSVPYTVWFLAKPTLVLVGYYAIEEWRRTKIYNGVELGICATSYLVFLYLLRPSRANHNFPFHIRTNQISVILDAKDSNFPHTEDFAKLAPHDGGPLEASLSRISRIPSDGDENSRPVTSTWFEGMN